MRKWLNRIGGFGDENWLEEWMNIIIIGGFKGKKEYHIILWSFQINKSIWIRKIICKKKMFA